jgi:hypothetical protein
MMASRRLRVYFDVNHWENQILLSRQGLDLARVDAACQGLLLTNKLFFWISWLETD